MAQSLSRSPEDPRQAQLAATRDDGASLGWPDGPDVIVMGMSPHALSDPTFSLRAFEAAVRGMWGLVARAVPPHRPTPPRLIWVTTANVHTLATRVAANNRSACPGASAHRYAHPLPVLSEMNEIGRALAREMHADVLDQEAIRELSPNDGDGMHCISGLVCKGTLEALLNLLALAPAA